VRDALLRAQSGLRDCVPDPVYRAKFSKGYWSVRLSVSTVAGLRPAIVLTRRTDERATLVYWVDIVFLGSVWREYLPEEM
jgi:hypothetical protein